MIINFMPVLGRNPLLISTINRLYRVNKVDLVICVGDRPEDKAVCEALGAEWVHYPNFPLGAKCNAALKRAMTYDPDWVVMSFSSDFISANWIPTLIKHAGKADLIGTAGCYFLQAWGAGKHERKEWIYWGGYDRNKEPERYGEPIGGGRMFTGRILKKLNGRLFANEIDNGLDWSSMNRVIDAGGEIRTIKDYAIKNVGIGCDRWPNKHRFEQEKKYVTARELTKKEIAEMYQIFPEAVQLFNR